MAPARSWPSRVTTSATLNSPRRLTCRSYAWSRRASTRPRSPLKEPSPSRALLSIHETPGLRSTACPRPRPRRPSPIGSKKRGIGKKTVNYKLRDWLFSRQRYWGEPFPVVLDENDRTQAVPESELPVHVARARRFQADRQARAPAQQGQGLGPLLGNIPARDQHDAAVGRARAGIICDTLIPRTRSCPGTPRKRSTGCRSTSTSAAPSTPVLHLLYSRFWHKVLFDRGLVSTPEPFQKLVNQGMILGETEYTGYRDAAGNWVRPRRASRPGVDCGKLVRKPGRPRRARGSSSRLSLALRVEARAQRCQRPVAM